MKSFPANIVVLCLFSAALTALQGNAQEVGSPPISTERPTVGDSPDLIPAGSIQFENGAGVSFQKAGYIGDLPETLVRFGLSERAEVRFMTSDEVYHRSSVPSVDSFQTMDPAVSVKVGLGKANQLVPRSGILALSFPRGGRSWTSGSYDPSLIAVWTQTIGKRYFVNEVAGATLTTLAGARRPSWAPSVAGGRSLTEAVTAFAEYAPTVLPDRSLEYVVDGGFVLVHKRLMQFDVRSGYLKDPTGYHTLITVGFSMRRDRFLPSFGHSSAPIAVP